MTRPSFFWCLLLTCGAIGPAGAADLAEPQSELYRALVADSTVTLHLRSYLFDRQNPGDVENEAWAGGGWLGYETGWIGDVLKLGVVGYTSLPIWAPENKDGTLLLKPGQEGYGVIGQAYAALKFEEQVATFYRQSVNQPEVNPQDNRMTPNTFEGATLGGEFGQFGYFGGVLTRMKKRNADEFVNMAKAAGIDGEFEPMMLGGVTFAPIDDLKARAALYVVPDVLASSYFDAVWTTPLTDETDVRLAGQFMYQGSIGDHLLSGESTDTWVAGIKGDLIYGGLTLTAGFTQTGESYYWQSPYGSWPGYSGMIVKDFNRAGEWAAIAGAAFDFASVGAEGLSLTALAAFGGGAEDPATGDSLSDNTEYDVTLDYRFSAFDDQPWLQPLWLRARYAHVAMDSGGDTDALDDFRVIVNYEWKFGGEG